MINQTKTKTMIFNYKYQFNTRLTLSNEILETFCETKLLGTYVTNDLKWDRNTEIIVRKLYLRMEIISKLSSSTLQ